MTDAQTRKRRRCLLACLALLALGSAAHVAYLVGHCPLDLTGDEAYYWQWSRRLDLSYADTNGPLTAYLIAAARPLLEAWSQRMVGSAALAVRLPAVGLSALTGLGIYVLASTATRRPRVGLAAVGLTFTIPILVVGSLLMTIDAPLVCAWTWALVGVQRALARDRLHVWLVTGVLIALGLLSKFTMVLIFPVVGLLVLAEPELRRFVRRPGPYVAAAVGLLGSAPIVYWNAQNGWPAFRQVSRQAGLGEGFHFDPLGPVEYAGAQMAIVGIIWLVVIVWAAVDVWRRPKDDADAPATLWPMRLMVLATAVPWLTFLGFSLITKVQPNWPVPALIGGTILLAGWLARNWSRPASRRRTRRLTVAGVALGAALVLVMHRTEWIMPVFGWLARGAPPLGLTSPAAPWELTPAARYDPSNRLRGWSQLGTAVSEVLEAERAAGRDPFLLAAEYETASLIAFYTRGTPPVYSAQAALGGRRSQYDLWPNPIRDRKDFLGRPCLYVGSLHKALTGDGPGGHAALPGLRPVRTVEHWVAGQRVQVWTIFACDAFAGFEVVPGK